MRFVSLLILAFAASLSLLGADLLTTSVRPFPDIPNPVAAPWTEASPDQIGKKHAAGPGAKKLRHSDYHWGHGHGHGHGHHADQWESHDRHGGHHYVDVDIEHEPETVKDWYDHWDEKYEEPHRSHYHGGHEHGHGHSEHNSHGHGRGHGHGYSDHSHEHGHGHSEHSHGHDHGHGHSEHSHGQGHGFHGSERHGDFHGGHRRW